MAYIGKIPLVGNFQICDAISVVNGQAAYTMQVASVNVIPETAQNLIVSLNGVIQKPGSSFTVSGSTITFASNLVTGDVIDFIQILGSVLDIGTPSDNTVTTAKLADSSITTAKLNDASVSLAKLTATGTKSSSTFLRGDNTFDTPSVASLSTASGSATSYSARAWINFNGNDTVSIRGSANVSSLTDNGVGNYQVNLIDNMPNTNYAGFVCLGGDSSGSSFTFHGTIHSRAVGSFGVNGTAYNVGTVLKDRDTYLAGIIG